MTIEQSGRRFAPWRYVGIALIAIVALIGTAFVWTNLRTRTAGNLPVASSSGAATQTSEGGNVTIKATWQGASAGPVFTIVMDTHAVDLDGYDLIQLAVLRTDQGAEVQPTGWDAPKGGHHRQGTLTFPATTADGRPLLTSDTRSIQLVIRDVAGVPERSFQWTP